jgi:hypothetical protein
MIKNILKQQTIFEGAENLEKFHAIFTSLYNIHLFKPGLDLVLTRMQSGDLQFEIKIIKGWDTNVGCHTTEQTKVFNKILNVFVTKLKHKVTIRNLLVNVVAHEMAHALEAEGGIVLNEDFRKAIGFDMKDRKPQNLALAGAINHLMVEDTKSYASNQIISELFSRYFELLSLSRDVQTHGDFLTKDVMDFFSNTTRWIDQVFNARIKAKVDIAIANHSAKLIEEKAFKQEPKFAHKVESFYKKVDEKGQKTWGANVKSNAAWQKSWQKHEATIEGKKSNTIEDKSDK